MNSTGVGFVKQNGLEIAWEVIGLGKKKTKCDVIGDCIYFSINIIITEVKHNLMKKICGKLKKEMFSI